MHSATALSVKGLSKSFDGQLALDSFDIELRSGEIHAFLGQNGSGKSTLIKLLAGYHQPTSLQSAELHGLPFEVGSAGAARDGGLHFIHQDLGLIPALDTIDNLALDGGYAGRWWLSGAKERQAAMALCERYGVSVDVSRPVGELTPAEQTSVAIVRALSGGIEQRMLLVLDEPTATLPSHEVAQLFGLLREVRASGATVLYVTHRLGEVFEIADRVTVIRDGRRVATEAVEELNHDRLLRLIIGSPVDTFYPTAHATRAEVALNVKGLTGGRVSQASLEVRRGETVGVTGLVGSGYEDLLRLVFDPAARAAGEITVDGAVLTGRGIAAPMRHRIAFVPADRRRLAGFGEWTARENLTLPRLSASRFTSWMGGGGEREEARRWLQRLGVTPPDPNWRFAALSGGNQQKVILARWLRCEPRTFLLEEPTNGIDVGAKQAIYASIAEVSSGGAAVLLSSTDVEELCAICDRVVVMHRGRIRTILDRADLSEDRLRTETARDDGARS